MRRLLKHPYVKPAATHLVLLLAVAVWGSLSLVPLLSVFIAIVIEVAFARYMKVYGRLVPVERLTQKTNSYFPQTFMAVLGWGLVFTPVAASLAWWGGYAWAGVLVLPAIPALVRLVERYWHRAWYQKDCENALNGFAPEVVVYLSGPKDVAYQINQWLPVLEQLEQKAVILLRERGIYDRMEDTSIPVYVARRAMDVESVLEGPGTVQTVLYPANPMKNVQALRHHRLNHFFINHGESDKVVNQSKLLMAYDRLLVGGPLAERRLREAGLPLRDGQVVHVGRPQTEILLDSIDSPGPIRTVLYAPTWEGFVDGANYSSVGPIGMGLLQEIVDDGRFAVMFKPHPYTGIRSRGAAEYRKKMEELCRENGMECLDSMIPIHECMNRSDLLITDVSSVLNEYLATNKPIIVCNVQGHEPDSFAKEFPSTVAAYRLDAGGEILDVLNAAAEDPLWETRMAVRRDSLGDFPEGALARFKSVISESVESGGERSGAAA